jgi:STE24 endopeptidase
MSPYLFIVLAILAGVGLLEIIANWLNLRRITPELPAEFADWFDAGKYRTAQEYLRANTRLEILNTACATLLVILLICSGGFDLLDRLARGAQAGLIGTGLIFAGLLGGLAWLVNLPFAVWQTFGIEEKYGFNRTTARTFILDQIKGILVAAVIGGVVLALVLLLFDRAGAAAWLYCWIAVSCFQLFLLFIAPVTILPLFNKFTPLAEGELKTAIETYAAGQGFRMKGVFTMDGSRRSSKANALFTGFGKFKRIVLFDTLISQHPAEELVAVLAHEMGHYKLRHILRMTIWSLAVSAVFFYLMSLLVGEPKLFEAFRMSRGSLYAGVVLFGILLLPAQTLLAVAGNWLARRHEYAADAYTVATGQRAEVMIRALQRLSVQRLANLTPHPLKVALDYTHPPILQRIAALRRLQT